MEAFDQEPDKKRLKLEQDDARESEENSDIVTAVADTVRPDNKAAEAVVSNNSNKGGFDQLNQDSAKASDKDVVLDMRAQPVKEIDVGITEYISKHEGFHGVIKQR